MEATCRPVRHFRAEDLASPSASFILRCSDSFCHLQRRHLQRPSRTLLKARLRLPRGRSLSPLALQGLSCFDVVAESLSAAYISRSAHGLRSPPPAPALTLAPTLLGFCVRRRVQRTVSESLARLLEPLLGEPDASASADFFCNLRRGKLRTGKFGMWMFLFKAFMLRFW